MLKFKYKLFYHTKKYNSIEKIAIFKNVVDYFFDMVYNHFVKDWWVIS